MPIERAAAGPLPAAAMPATRRILRLSLGTALSLAVTQALAWPLAYIAPVLTLFFLALPMPAPGFKKGIGIVVALLVPMLAGLALLPFLLHARWAGIVLLGLALFFSFYYTARGGSQALGSIVTIGLTLVITVGSVNPDVLVFLIATLAKNALVGMAFVWIAHALLPDRALPAAARKKAPPPPVDPVAATRSALRSLLVVLPITLVFLFISASPAFTPVMIKVASMGQQASARQSRAMGLSLLSSTLWGGLAACGAYLFVTAWPSLVPYTLAVALAGLLFGRRIFDGAGVHPDHSKWSYAYLTMLILLGPAFVDTFGGGGVGFMQRLGLFVLIAVYGTVAVRVFDAFMSGKQE